jgi:signal transduction histidine kinase
MADAAEEGGHRTAWLRTTVFRVTLLHLLLTLGGTALIYGLAYWSSSRVAAGQIAAAVERDVRLLFTAAEIGGTRGVALSVEARIAADNTAGVYYLLSAPDGGRIAGNLARAPRAPGWTSLRLREEATERELVALGTVLPGGAFLVAARDMAPVRELEASLSAAAGWVGGGAVLLGLLGGALISRGVARRAAAMSHALAAVERGDLARRLAVREGGDEFDRLATRINATLDRLGEVMGALRRVTDDIAHDLRTPLGRLRQRLEAALRGAREEAEWQAAVEGAIADCDRILGIFAALLRIAQVEGAARHAGFAEVDLSGLAADVAEVYAPAAEERGQSLSLHLAPGVAARGDRELLAQMLANLVENAVRHGREGGRIRLSLARGAGGGATLVIADDGPGIPAAEREQVFRRFHRLDTARATPGTGLGLALVKAIAELHGIGIVLADAGPGLSVRLAIPPGPDQAPPGPRSP